VRSITVAGIFAVPLLLVGCGGDPSSPEGSAQTEPRRAEIVDVIAKNTTALGGEEALDAVQTMVKTSLIEEGDYRDIAVFATDRQGRMRIDIFADGKRVFAESYDGQRGHQWSQKNGQTDSSERGEIALSHTPQLPNHIFRLKDVVENGHEIALLGPEEIDGIGYYVLKLTLSDGFENFLFVDAESGLATRSRNRRALHVDIDDEEKSIESRISDFRQVGDIVHPHSVIEVDLGSGEILNRVTLESLEINKELPEGYFGDLVHLTPEQ